MSGMRYVAGLAVLGLALAALAWAQSSGQLPPSIDQPVSEVVQPAPTSLPAVNPATSPNMQAAQNVQAPHRANYEEQEFVPGPTPEIPTGRQEPAVSLEWIGPPVAKLGRAADYTIAVRNVCNIPVQQVMVRVRIPNGMSVSATQPKAIAEGNVLMWELGTMMPKQERNLQLRLLPEGKGDARCQAWVTFTGASGMVMKVTEPQLVLKAQAPDRVMVGDAATFVLTVTNPGDGPADQVRIHVELSEGLEHVKGRIIDFEIGNLAPGESRSVQLICATKAGGPQFCHAVAESEALRSEDRVGVNVIMPRIELDIVKAPKLRYLDRPATYVFRVTNPGDASATNVSITDVIPLGFKFTSASHGGRHDFSTRTVTWFLGEIGPGQSKEVELNVIAINPGEHIHRVSAKAARGLHDEKETITTVKGLSAILLEVVDTADPIEANSETSYEIRITNTGSASESEIKLVCHIPDEMEFKSAQGPARYHKQGKDIIFEPLPKLAPRADAIFRVNVKAIAPGSIRFTTQVTSKGLVQPVIEQEATRIYAD
ncbi:MAG: hypothetical protein KatS3mg105_0894 [Gemmatales bacterium]|nr:MAG: hypothetical protein KatS3mg105_0894 [Gemmatales bacterium]